MLWWSDGQWSWFQFGADQVSGHPVRRAHAGTGSTIDLAARESVICRGATGYFSGAGLIRDAGNEKKVGPMSVVVERGSARCPRCVAVADYAFIESDLDVVRYEVHCHSCGEVYSEVNSLAPAAPVELTLPLPPPSPVAQRRASWRRHLTPFGRASGRLRERVRRAGFAGLVSPETPTSGE